MAADYKISALIDCYGSLLSPKQRNIIEQYYNEDLSLSEIAENESITRQGVSDFIKRTEQALHGFEECLGLYKTGKKLKKLALEVESFDYSKEQTEKLIDYINKSF